MIQIPEVGFQQSVNQSNVSVNALADWLEATTLFDEPEVAKSDVVDLLVEHQICSDRGQEMAHRIASEGWNELARRKRWGGVPATVSITKSRISIDHVWEDDPIRAFFVLLSALRIYPDWATAYRQYAIQGELFERVVEQICPALLPGWTVYRTGWSPDDTKDISVIVDDLCSRIFVAGAPDPGKWLGVDAKDGGLDLVCYRSFEDEREALPVFFLQCASGKNWRDKVNTPSAALWQKLLDSAVSPSTGIVAPFVVEAKELQIAALVGQVVVFDRLRMLSAIRTHRVTFVQDLLDELTTWISPRVRNLPRTE